MIHVAMSSCQDTIEKWMRDGMSQQKAEQTLQQLQRCKLLEIIRVGKFERPGTKQISKEIKKLEEV